MPKELYNPGSRRAIDEGCECPVMDNNSGDGFLIDGEQCFWYTESCPYHFPKTKEDKDG